MQHTRMLALSRAAAKREETWTRGYFLKAEGVKPMEIHCWMLAQDGHESMKGL